MSLDQSQSPSGRKHLTYTVAEAAEQLRISDKSLYRLISAGEIQTTDVGTARRARTRITREALERFLDRRLSDRPRKQP